MATKVYGYSDDLVMLDGDVGGQYEPQYPDEDGCGLFFSDGTVLAVIYGKDDKGIWAIQVMEKGSLFERLDICTDEKAKVYSDVAHFRDGLTWAYATYSPERIK